MTNLRDSPAPSISIYAETMVAVPQREGEAGLRRSQKQIPFDLAQGEALAPLAPIASTCARGPKGFSG
jgi:hypothetical protein